MGQKTPKLLMPPDCSGMQFNSDTLCFMLGVERVLGVYVFGVSSAVSPMEA